MLFSIGKKTPIENTVKYADEDVRVLISEFKLGLPEGQEIVKNPLFHEFWDVWNTT